jgi:hypothetical protein
MLVGHSAARLINADILAERRAALNRVAPPTEFSHILEFSPAVLAPTTNLALIKRSWLGITEQILVATIRKLRSPVVELKPTFAPRSGVLRELLQTRTRVAPASE